MQDDIYAYAVSWVSEISVPESFLDDLRKSDDWTFLVQATALIESSLAHVLREEFNRPQLERFVVRLSLDQKLKLASDLDALSGFQKFMRYMKDLRNVVVHDIRMTKFSLREHLSDPARLRDFTAALPGAPDDGGIAADKWLSSARGVMWLVLVGLLANAYAHVRLSETRRRMADFYAEKGRAAGPGLGDRELWARIVE